MTTVVTLNIVNPDGTFPASAGMAYAVVTWTLSGDPMVVGQLFPGTYAPTTGKVSWTLPQSSQVRFLIPDVKVNGVYALGTASTYTLNDLVPVSAPATAPAYMSLYALLAGATFTGDVTAPSFVGDLTGTASGNIPAVTPGTTGNVLTSDGTAWTSAAPTGGGAAYPTPDAAGWWHSNGSGTYAWSTPTYADVGALASGGTAANSSQLEGHAAAYFQPALGFTPENAANRGAINGYAPLDAAQLVPIGNLPTGATAFTVCIGNDSRLSDARVPTAHASSHITGGSDIIATFGAAASGLVPASGGGTTNFLRADGSFAAPPGGSPGGSTTQLQFNNAGAFGGVPGTAADASTGAITLTAGAATTTPLTITGAAGQSVPVLTVMGGNVGIGTTNPAACNS